MLLQRGARVNATNMGDDIPLHLASAHNHYEIVMMLLKQRSDVNATNEHGNTPLHYACFWGCAAIAEELVNHGALVSLANKDGDTPLDKAKAQLAKRLHDLGVESGQELRKISFKDQSWLGLKTRSRDATLSRFKGINVEDLELHTKLAITPSGTAWRGKWQRNDIVAKILARREYTARVSRDFNEEFPKLRIFSHPNILPIIGACNSPQTTNLITITQVGEKREEKGEKKKGIKLWFLCSTCRGDRCTSCCTDRRAWWWTRRRRCDSRLTLPGAWRTCIRWRGSYRSII